MRQSTFNPLGSASGESARAQAQLRRRPREAASCSVLHAPACPRSFLRGLSGRAAAPRASDGGA
eukprot:3893434-Alexandrium_andersonii.AAC.1